MCAEKIGVRRLGLILALVVFSCPSSASAGLYNTSEPEAGKLGRDNFALVFRDTLLRLRTIGMRQVPLDNPLRKRYLLQANLAGRANLGKLTTEEKLNLSDVLVRCKRADDASTLLEPLALQAPKNFLVRSNLATAYQQAGQERRAIDTLEQALGDWPTQFEMVPEPMHGFLQSIGWHEGAFEFYRQAETCQLKLLKLRAREGLARKGAPFEAVDALFDDGRNPPHPVRFLAPTGKFEAGQLAPEEKAKLPKNAIEIVQQLLIWLPEDVRLYWLLGELYNAQGGAKNIQAARMIFEELAGLDGLGVRAPQLVEHRKSLRDYKTDENEPGFSDLGKKLDEMENNRQDKGPGVNWQTLGVGFGAGIVVTVFGMWQVREIRRRRRRGV